MWQLKIHFEYILIYIFYHVNETLKYLYIMVIKLKSLLKEAEQSHMKIQIYMDLDGVMADFDGGFKKITKKSPTEFENSSEFADKKAAAKAFWKAIDSVPTFWENLNVLPGSKTLWQHVSETYNNPPPVVLTAGSKSSLNGKLLWLKKNIGPNTKMILAEKGSIKYKYILEHLPNTLHVLIDDLKINVDNWNNSGKNHIGILHKNPADTISQLQNILKDEV